MTRPPSRSPLAMEDTKVLKALGISAIVLHNYFHWRNWTHAVVENEFSFRPERIFVFLQEASDPRYSIQSLFSYLGHFGVQLFIFLSAYGLACAYFDSRAGWGGFMWGRLKKLYPMWFLVLALWFLTLPVRFGESSWMPLATGAADDMALTALAVINVVPGYALPPVGPWWFLPFIVQFYALWPGLAAFARRFQATGLLVLGVLVTGAVVAVNPVLTEALSINLMETPLGHAPELLLGVAVARFGLRVGPALFCVAVVTFVAGNLERWLWPFTFASALVVALYVYEKLGRRLRGNRLLEFLAGISMPLFFINGFLREPFLRLAELYPEDWAIDLFIGVLYFFTCVIAARVLLALELRLMRPLRAR